MTQDEIIDKAEGDDISEYPHYALNDFQRRTAMEAMDMWAKQQALLFNEWMEDNNFMKHRGMYYNRTNDGKRWEDIPQYTRNQLYAQFIESQNK